MNYLLTSDLHLTDSSLEEYRWNIFDILKKESKKHKVTDVFILGDMWDRKDRHSGKLVNRIVDSLLELSNDVNIWILSGNHDAPLAGVYFWEFLNHYPKIRYITKPEFLINMGVWLLPFSSNPVRDWSVLPLSSADALFMHQPIQGAFVDEYRKLQAAPILPPLPPIPCFSGDIHHPQTLGTIIYLGVPHPVHFNETWRNRIILIENSAYKNYKEIFLDFIKRSLLDIESSDELVKLKYKKGDQVRIRYLLKGENLSSWSLEQEKIRQWANEKGIILVSVEAKLIGDGVKAESQEKAEQIELMRPEEVIKLFGMTEKLSEDVIQAGLDLVK